MKKSKLAIGLVSSFIGALAMGACSGSVTSNDNAIVTINGYNGETINVITNDVYEQYRYTSDGIIRFYNSIMEVLIRYQFQENTIPGIKTYSEIVTDAENNVKSAKSDARDNAKTNGTSYDEEWESYLTSQGVEDEDELLELFIYNLEKEEIEDWYANENEEALKAEYIGVNDEGAEVESSTSSGFPYHIRHILVSVSGDATDYTRSTISSTEAKKLSTIVKEFAEGIISFGQIAYTSSDDDSSAQNYGDVGIMDLTTSFVNEFKLGIYAFDGVLSRSAENRDSVITNGLGISDDFDNSTVEETVEDIGLTYVPYDAFAALGTYAEEERDSKGMLVNDGYAASYPRNIYWNKYINLHNPFVISNNDLNVDAVDGQGSTTYLSVTDAQPGHSGWRYVEGVCNNSNQRVLTDEQGRVIIGVRSEHGVHFMVMQKSIYEFTTGGEDTENVSLSEYYTTAVPSDSDYPVYVDSNGVSTPKITYVNYLNTSDQSVLKQRATEVKDKIESFDSTYEYRLYEYFVSKNTIQFNDTNGVNLGEEIQKMIDAKREYNNWSAKNTLNDSWVAYLEMVQRQDQTRTSQRLIPETCAIGFKDASSDPRFEVGGSCYYVE